MLTHAMMKHKPLIVAITCLALVGLVVSGWLLVTTQKTQSQTQPIALGQLPFTLIDQYNNERHFADYGDQHALIFFGFTPP